MSQTFSEGIILSCIGGRYAVLSDGMRYSCYAKGSLRHAGIKPLCGDRVRFVKGACFEDDGTPLPPSTESDGYLCEVLPRTSLLRRPPIANIDTLLLVVAAATPTPDTLFIDRLTVCADLAGIEPIILINKCDLDESTADKITAIYQAAGFQTHCISALQNSGIDLKRLSELLQGKTTAMAGFSGVGKTTFFNRLFPNEKGTVGSLSQKLSRGKNTTRTTELHSLKRSILSVDGLFADTAGFSRLELSELNALEPDELVYHFPDFDPFLTACKFTKCTHQKELGCAIRTAVENESLSKSRYQSFTALYQELKAK